MADKKITVKKAGKLSVRKVNAYDKYLSEEPEILDYIMDKIFENKSRSDIKAMVEVKWPGMLDKKFEAKYQKSRELIKISEGVGLMEVLHQITTYYDDMIEAFRFIGRDDLLIQAHKQKEKLLKLEGESLLVFEEKMKKATLDRSLISKSKIDRAKELMKKGVK